MQTFDLKMNDFTAVSRLVDMEMQFKNSVSVFNSFAAILKGLKFQQFDLEN